MVYEIIPMLGSISSPTYPKQPRAARFSLLICPRSPNQFVPTVHLHHKTLNDPMKRHIFVAHLLEERKGGRSIEYRVVWLGAYE